MYRKLDDQALGRLLEVGVDEFATHGLDRANINVIARKADLSVGVIYKYFQDKDTFFLACVRHSLKLLDQVLDNVIHSGDDILESIHILVHSLIQGAIEHKNYYVMYNEITSGSCRKYASELAAEIEKRPPLIYKALVEKAQADGKIHMINDPKMFVFFFDNLLMMLQFSFCCDYYRERMKIFLGDVSLDNPTKVEDELVTFISQCLGIENATHYEEV